MVGRRPGCALAMFAGAKQGLARGWWHIRRTWAGEGGLRLAGRYGPSGVVQWCCGIGSGRVLVGNPGLRHPGDHQGQGRVHPQGRRCRGRGKQAVLRGVMKRRCEEGRAQWPCLETWSLRAIPVPKSSRAVTLARRKPHRLSLSHPLRRAPQLCRKGRSSGEL